MSERLTPEREAEARNAAALFPRSVWVEVLAELDAVRNDLAEAIEWRNVWNPDIARWQRLYAECVGDISDADLGRLVRSLARECYAEAAAMATDGAA